jgi:hypothetical protein
MNATYSAILRRTAAPWGIVLPADRLLDDADVPRPVVVERLHWSTVNWQRCDIELVTLNGLWSFALSVADTHCGGGFDAFLKFCEPVATRDAALAAAVAYIRSLDAHPPSPQLAAWLRSIEPTQQLSLFAL